MRNRRHDRHGRAVRADNDRRRRPSDGFRAAHADRFADLVSDAITELPEALADAVATLDVLIVDVPEIDDETLAAAREVPLARLVGAGRSRRLEVYRRPIESRAVTRHEVIGVARLAIGAEVARALGIEDDGLYDEDAEGW